MARVSAGHPSIVVRPEAVVRYIEVSDEISEIRAAWSTLEELVGSLRGRKFVAAFDPVQGWYRACVESKNDVAQAERELPEMIVPGGRFARIRLHGHPPGIYDQVPVTYAALEAWAERDDSRPCLEQYRRSDEIDVLMPMI